MIVDDEIANIELIGAVLEEDYEIVFARSGEQAIELARKAPLDLILLDVVMPGLDGYETCRRIKERQDLAHVPVIFMTGLKDTESVVRGLGAGGVDYVTKPTVPDEIIARIRVHLANARLASSAQAARWASAARRQPGPCRGIAPARSMRRVRISASML